MIREINQPSAVEIKLVDNFFDKKASNFLKDFIPAIQGVDGLFFSSFFFLKKNSEMGGKMEQLETRLQDSEHEVNLKLTAGREE